jgi:putative toxin-antitoxin system antitoxin component (TIGR02293 family)
VSVVVPSQSFELIQGLSRDLDLSAKQVGELLDIHPRTLLRRQESGILEEVELLRAQMLDEVFKLATTAFHDTGKAKAWLFSEVTALDFGRPVDQLKTIRGYERVKNLLGQTIFGVY